jgi:prepilin peptidase CpaA
MLALFGLLLLACASDLRSRRIPNRLILTGMLLGLVFQFLADRTSGVFTASWGGHGLLQALYGLLLGLGLFLPFYLIRGLGAGDVKLLAMIGAWLGPQAIFNAALLTMVMGGVLALGAALWQRSLRQVVSNVWFMLTHMLATAGTGQRAALEAPASTTGRLPYAVAIAAGTVIQTALMVWPTF